MAILIPTTKHIVIQVHATLKQRVEKGIEMEVQIKTAKGKIVTHRSSTERRLNYAMIDHSTKMEHTAAALISKNSSPPDRCYLIFVVN